MFNLDIPPVIYTNAWDTSFNARLRTLAGGECRVAFYYGHMPDSSTFRYRCINMAMILNELGGVSASFFFRSELDKLHDIVNIADIIIICRAKYCNKLGHAITVAKNKGKTVIFDIDDLMFDPKYIQLVMQTIGIDYTNEEVWQYWYGDSARYGATLALCDRIVTTNDYLAEMFRNFSEKHVSVIPNFLNEAQLEVSRKIFKIKEENGYSRNNPVYLGYFSGTHTHNNDFRILTEALLFLFNKYDNLKLRIVGLLELDERLSDWSDRIEILPIHDYINLQKIIGEVEINLIPLQENAFTNSKSELKYFEAGITGTVSVATPTYVYSHAIRDGHNGFLANSYEWTDKIDGILSEMGNYPELARNAFRHSEENYSWENLTRLIEKTYIGK